MKTAVSGFISHLRDEEHKSENTCLSYERDLRQFSVWADARHLANITDISASDLSDYRDSLESAGKSPATVSRACASLKALFSYARKEGMIVSDISESLRAPKVFKKRPDILSDREVLRLLSAPDEKNPKGKRDKAMLELLWDTGMRVSELLGIRNGDISLQKDSVKIGGGRERTVPFDKKTEKYIRDYLENAREKLLSGGTDSGFLFLNVSGESMSRQGFWKVLKKYGELAGIEQEITPHTLRHSYAAHALRNGKDIKEVQMVMGHADAATTQGYLEF